MTQAGTESRREQIYVAGKYGGIYGKSKEKTIG